MRFIGISKECYDRLNDDNKKKILYSNLTSEMSKMNKRSILLKELDFVKMNKDILKIN
ncbi:hypothetical protein SCORR_v1c06060 [Spiroplasma corruscae]|uniref:Uncharacterized protein n=1 Tax=Spiroplasma corruscae TaxID=216934 RepID=A0A222EPE0_9MOLU|nr:hypothetical protein [Spiroplasma corruscae]ASP28378.1 hypothetical protein SCORR_v1c06060 [Spiroplasma corruscae]